MDEASHHRDVSRRRHNEEFVRRLNARRPEAKQEYEQALREAVARAEAALGESALGRGGLESMPLDVTDMALETIVFRERPVLFVKDDWIDTVEVTSFGDEAKDLVATLDAKRRIMQPMLPLIGRIDVTGFPGNDYVGTGWFVDTDIVVTNRHVASLIARWDGREFAFSRGVAGTPITSSVSTLHEFDDLVVNEARLFPVSEVLYIEKESGPDIAFLKVRRRTDGARPDRIAVASSNVGDNVRVFVVGYPARAPRSVIPDQALMRELYRDRFDVKRAAPGFTMATLERATRHDCTTLGGNSGSVVLNLETGEAVGLHFAGLYQETNFAVPASVVADYVSGRRWNKPVVVETGPGPLPPSRRPAASAPAPAATAAIHTALAGGDVTVTIPLSITVSLGLTGKVTQPANGAAQPALVGLRATAEAAARAFWKDRPRGVVAVRVGFFDEDDRIGDTPYIAASVPASELATVAAQGSAEFLGHPVRYVAANVAEQIDALAHTESVDSIDYDDAARTGAGFSFDPVEEEMTVRAHVGPEYSWDELNAFLEGAQGSLVSAIYEFHAPQVKDAIEARLDDGMSLTLVMDNATFSEVGDDAMEFDRDAVFRDWKARFTNRFKRIVAPEGRAGLISDSYHIKVTVRQDDRFWLSSGNWKKTSSQPVITQAERDVAAERDLPGNREWHVIVANATLANRFRNHILQDFKRSRALGGGESPRSREAADIFVDVPVEETVFLERRPPGRVLEPLPVQGRIKVKPLLTPDREGAVYSEAVLDLIRSAEQSLLFQIPYIAMPSNPNVSRGYIDELIDALTEKLRTLRHARIILRTGGRRYASPTHAAWYFKSKGVDIDERLRWIDNHHTKGMIVDGKRVLIGSHNWSKSGVTLNRDASLIFDDERIAGYFAQAFAIDWDRANPIRPAQFGAREAVILEAVGATPPPGFRRVRMSDLLKEDD